MFSIAFGELAETLFLNKIVGLKSSKEFEVLDYNVYPVYAVGKKLFALLREFEITFSNLL
jgi:hypothetical protein